MLSVINLNSVRSQELVYHDSSFLVQSASPTNGLCHGGVILLASTRTGGVECLQEDDVSCHRKVAVIKLAAISESNGKGESYLPEAVSLPIIMMRTLIPDLPSWNSFKFLDADVVLVNVKKVIFLFLRASSSFS